MKAFECKIWHERAILLIQGYIQNHCFRNSVHGRECSFGYSLIQACEQDRMQMEKFEIYVKKGAFISIYKQTYIGENTFTCACC